VPWDVVRSRRGQKGFNKADFLSAAECCSSPNRRRIEVFARKQHHPSRLKTEQHSLSHRSISDEIGRLWMQPIRARRVEYQRPPLLDESI